MLTSEKQKRLLRAALIPAALSITLTLVACSKPTPTPTPAPATAPPVAQPAGDVELTQADNGKTVGTTPGVTVILTLPDNASTGYTWEPLGEIDAAVLEQIGDETIPPADAMPGAAGERVWTFETVGPGTAQIRLAAVPPGEKVDDKYESFAVTVEVAASA